MDRNEDWDFEYLFGSYLKIYSCEEEKFLFFLEQYVNPVIRRKRKDKETECWEEIENSDIAECINRYLEHEGYKLSQVDTIADKPLFKIQSMNPGVANSHFLRTAGPHFPDSSGHIKRTAWEISRAEGTPPY